MKKFLIILLCLASVAMSFGQKISEEEAMIKAQNFVNKKFHNKGLLQQTRSASSEKKNVYIFNISSNDGFVIVAGDSRVKDILGYSETGNIDENNMPTSLKWLLENYSKQISQLKGIAPVNTRANEGKANVRPLLETKWGQGDPYNRMCPEIDGQKTLTGCVATALAQVINYHRWPQGETNSVAAYTTARNQLKCEELPPTTFDWNNMNAAEMSKLMRYCGQAVEMDYGLDGSGSGGGIEEKAVLDVFNFSKTTKYVRRDDYVDKEWNELVYEQLSLGMPLYYGGAGAGGGHAFVVDGFEDGLYHVNWGWEGSCDGYFTLEHMNPTSGDGFNFGQSMLINMAPPVDAGNIKRPRVIVNSISCDKRVVTRTDASVSIPDVTIGASLESLMSDDAIIKTGVALYNEDGLVQVLASNENKIAYGIDNQVQYLVEFSGNLPLGEYYIKTIDRSDDSDEWMTDFGAASTFVLAEVNETNVQFTPFPVSWKDRNEYDFGIQTIDGITYKLSRVLVGGLEIPNYIAKVLKKNETDKYSGDIYIPDFVTYQNISFYVHDFDEDALYDSQDLTSLSMNIPGKGSSCFVRACPNLEKVEWRSKMNHIGGPHECPKIESVTYPISGKYINIPDGCSNLKEIIFLNNSSQITLGSGLVDKRYFNQAHFPSLTDIYFHTIMPPVFEEKGDFRPNPNVKVHIPKGSKGNYERSIWNGWDFVEDLPAQDGKLEWGYCGFQHDDTDGGIGQAWSNMDIEVAMRMTADKAKPYIGKKITGIEFKTNVNNYKDDDHSHDVEYVFLSSGNNKDYIRKQAANTIRGVWTRVEFDEPYTITGEELYVGIGRYFNLGFNFANNYYEEEGYWTRAMGDESVDEKIGKWQLAGDGYKDNKRPIAVRAIIEGENIPMDVTIIEAEAVLTKDAGPELLGSNVGDAHQLMKVNIINRSAYPVDKITFGLTIDDKKYDNQTVEVKMTPNYETYAYLALPNNIEGKLHKAKVEIVDVDGKSDLSIKNSLELNYQSAAEKMFPRKIVWENAANTDMGHSVYSIVDVQEFGTKFRDNLIPIFIHQFDEMHYADNSYDPYPIEMFGDVNVIGLPATNQNRTTKSLRDTEKQLEYLKDRAEAKISAEVQFVNSDSTKILVSTKTEFGFSDNGSTDYRLSFVVIEDNVGPYIQDNSLLSEPDSPHNDWDRFDWWKHQGNKVEMTFDNVARKIYDYYGIEGSLPETVSIGNVYDNSFKFDLPNNIQNKNNIRIIALLLNHNTGEIMNADYAVYNNSVVLGDISLDETTITMQQGETKQLILSISHGSETGTDVIWTSSNESVATVSSDGVVSALSAGSATITVTCGNLSATCLVKVAPEASSGDADGDGEYTESDVECVIEHILESLVEDNNDFYADAADVDGDGEVLIPDLTALIDLFNGAAPASVVARTRAGEGKSGQYIYMEQGEEIPQDSIGTTPMSLKNDVLIRGFQFDMEIPDCLTVSFEKAENTTDHMLVVDKVATDKENTEKYRVLCYSMSNTEYAVHFGLSVNAIISATKDTELGEYQLTLGNVYLSDSNNSKITDSGSETTVKVISKTESNGIISISADGVRVKIFTLDGKPVQEAAGSGIYIIKGKKVLK